MMALKITVLFVCFFTLFNASAQKNAELESRLSEFMAVSAQMQFDKAMDYTYPKLYTIVSREQLTEAMQSFFSNKNIRIQIDSLVLDSIYPVFNLENASFAKVVYSMNMMMDIKFPEKDSLDMDKKAKKIAFMIPAMKKQYGAGNVSIDSITGLLKIHIQSPMVAVKDSYAKEWCFVNLKKDDPILDRLFSKEILKKLATYQ